MKEKGGTLCDEATAMLAKQALFDMVERAVGPEVAMKMLDETAALSSGAVTSKTISEVAEALAKLEHSEQKPDNAGSPDLNQAKPPDPQKNADDVQPQHPDAQDPRLPESAAPQLPKAWSAPERLADLDQEPDNAPIPPTEPNEDLAAEDDLLPFPKGPSTAGLVMDFDDEEDEISDVEEDEISDLEDLEDLDDDDAQYDVDFDVDDTDETYSSQILAEFDAIVAEDDEDDDVALSKIADLVDPPQHEIVTEPRDPRASGAAGSQDQPAGQVANQRNAGQVKPSVRRRMSAPLHGSRLLPPDLARVRRERALGNIRLARTLITGSGNKSSKLDKILKRTKVLLNGDRSALRSNMTGKRALKDDAARAILRAFAKCPGDASNLSDSSQLTLAAQALASHCKKP
ncbi:MAG: hypothetical protein AAF968_07450 [Pseudomonadota bacterium]